MPALTLLQLIEETWPDLKADARDALAGYALMVQQWSPKMNLISASQDRALVEILFADAIALGTDPAFGESIKNASRVVDVGAGAGAPGIPLAILCEHFNMTLVEPRQKRVAFMNTVIGRLGLGERIRVMPDRIEEGKPLAPEARYDLAISRATFAPATWLELGYQMADQVVLFLSENPELQHAIPIAQQRYRLPFSRTPRVIEIY